MDRRQSLRLIATGAIASGAIAAGCNTPEDKTTTPDASKAEFKLDRAAEEIKREEELLAKGKFFDEHEKATIAVLADIIIPKDEVSGSASEAGVPEFIDFIVWDMPQHQVPLRGGLRWLDMQCFRRFEKSFVDSTPQQQLTMVDLIAYPARITEEKNPELLPGVAFFSLMRNLTVTGFYTSKEGVKDIGYVGNNPNQWNGVPDDVLKQYNLAYTEKELKECVKFS